MEDFQHNINFTHFEDLSRMISFNQFKFHGREREVRIFRVTLIIISIILSLVCVVGSIGNTLVIYVFSHHLRYGVSNLFITLLAVIDLVICLVDIPATLYWIVWQRDSVDLVCKIHSTSKAFFIQVSASILVLIAVDRFLLICFVPGIKLKPRTTTISLLITLSFGICLAVPFGLHSGVHDGIEISDNDILVNHVIDKNHSFSEVQNFMSNDTFLGQQHSKFLVGPCEPDENHITNPQFKHYTLSLFAVFIVMFTTLTLLYSFTFSFIWWRQYTRKRRYGASMTSSVRFLRREHHQVTGCDSVRTNDSASPVKERENVELEALICTTPVIIHHNDTGCIDQIAPIPENGKKTSIKLDKQSCSQNDAQYKRRKPHVRTAQTLALVTVLFFFSYTPYLLIINEFIFSEPILKLAQFNHNRAPSLTQHLKRLFFFMYFVNSATNPIIYSCMNQTFRKDVLTLLRRFNLIKSG